MLPFLGMTFTPNYNSHDFSYVLIEYLNTPMNELNESHINKKGSQDNITGVK